MEGEGMCRREGKTKRQCHTTRHSTARYDTAPPTLQADFGEKITEAGEAFFHHVEGGHRDLEAVVLVQHALRHEEPEYVRVRDNPQVPPHPGEQEHFHVNNVFGRGADLVRQLVHVRNLVIHSLELGRQEQAADGHQLPFLPRERRRLQDNIHVRDPDMDGDAFQRHLVPKLAEPVHQLTPVFNLQDAALVRVQCVHFHLWVMVIVKD